jgi:hypothetical protein
MDAEDALMKRRGIELASTVRRTGIEATGEGTLIPR